MSSGVSRVKSSRAAPPAPPGVAEKPPPEKPPEKGLSLAEPEPDCDPKGSPAEEPYGSCDEPRPPKRPPKVPPPRLGWTKPGSRLVAEPLSPVETAEAV